jgi:heme O synthase-like polyprenyltransferase
MNTKLLTKKNLLRSVILLFIFLGVQVASINYNQEVVTEGVLGLFFMYLFVRVFWSSSAGEENAQDYTFSSVVRLMVFVFVYSIVCFWAIVRIANMLELIWVSLGR